MPNPHPSRKATEGKAVSACTERSRSDGLLNLNEKIDISYYVAYYIKSLLAGEISNMTPKLKMPCYKVGDILVSDTSLEEYPADFLRIARLIGKTTLELEKLRNCIHKETVIAGWATPSMKEKNTPLLRGRIGKDGHVRYYDKRKQEVATKWNGKPVHYEGSCYY